MRAVHQYLVAASLARELRHAVDQLLAKALAPQPLRLGLGLGLGVGLGVGLAMACPWRAARTSSRRTAPP